MQPMTCSPHILIVEDDREIRDLVSRLLKQNGYRVSTATDGRNMDRILGSSRIDLVVLDIMLPGEDGLSLCRRLRSTSSLPIIMLTARGQETDRIVGLEVGADDYLPKPFNPRELLARIRAVLRRTATFPKGTEERARDILRFAGWRLDLGSRRLQSPDGLRVPLTSGEFDLLVAFCQHPGRVLTRDQLLDLTHGRAAKAFDRSVDIQVSRLRQKIEADPKDPLLIQTVRTGGYIFTPEVNRA